MKLRSALLAPLLAITVALCPLWAGEALADDASAGTEASGASFSLSTYRLYNPFTGEHLYTQDLRECDSLQRLGWDFEGTGWTAPSQGDPVYRLYNPYVAGGDHHYTTSSDERDRLVEAGWLDEGVCWYSDREKGVPLWRQYNPYATTGTHNFTSSATENLNLVSHGWRHEGAAWYGLDTGPQAPTDPFSGWVESSGERFYGYGDGTHATGWVNVEGRRLHFDDKGRLDTGLSFVDGTYYLFGSDGAPSGGWSQIAGFWYYFDPGTGEQYRGGWLDEGGKTYYLDKTSGAMVTGLLTIDGTLCLFDSDGSLNTTPGLVNMITKAQGYGSATNWLIMVDNTNNYLGVFRGGRGNWSLVNYWLCTTGKPSTPTVLGEYSITGRGYSFNGALTLPAYTCYYYTQFYGDYLIHSVEYYQNTFEVLDGRLGQNLSHGCVRLPIDQAKWIYDTIPYGTKLVSYR